MLGYKAFNNDWTCRGFQYEVGKTYRMEGIPECCEAGFHFCKKSVDCFDYYKFSSETKFALVESRGAVVTDDGKKFCTNAIKIIKEIPWSYVLELINDGRNNSGRENSGDGNSGCKNIGNWNTGNRNYGSWNSGHFNSGNGNTGDRNNGHWNTGDWNTGDWNSGDWNSGYFNSGCFNSRINNIFMFNKLSSWTMKDWLECEAKIILGTMPDDIKKRQNWYDRLDKRNKRVIKSLPNFDADIFQEVTGISVNKERRGDSK